MYEIKEFDTIKEANKWLEIESEYIFLVGRPKYIIKYSEETDLLEITKIIICFERRTWD